MYEAVVNTETGVRKVSELELQTERHGGGRRRPEEGALARNRWTADVRGRQRPRRQRRAVEELVMWVLPPHPPLLTWIKVMSAGMVCGMDSGLFWLLVCHLWENYAASFPDLCNGDAVVSDFGGFRE